MARPYALACLHQAEDTLATAESLRVIAPGPAILVARQAAHDACRAILTQIDPSENGAMTNGADSFATRLPYRDWGRRVAIQFESLSRADLEVRRVPDTDRPRPINLRLAPGAARQAVEQAGDILRLARLTLSPEGILDHAAFEIAGARRGLEALERVTEQGHRLSIAMVLETTARHLLTAASALADWPDVPPTPNDLWDRIGPGEPAEAVRAGWQRYRQHRRNAQDKLGSTKAGEELAAFADRMEAVVAARRAAPDPAGQEPAEMEP